MLALPVQGITIVLPFATPSQNVYMKWHWAKRAQLRDTCQLLIRAQLRTGGPLPRVKIRMGMELTRHGARLLDYGNLVGGAKGACDALTREGLIYDDSPRWLQDTYRQEQVPRSREKTIIVIYHLPR